MKQSTLKYIIAVLICEASGIISGVLSQSGPGAWYNSLNKPSFNPPSWIFGPVWTLLYLLIGIALGMVWNIQPQRKDVKRAEWLFATQLFLNFWWSILFFRFHEPGWAFVELIVLIMLIILTAVSFYSIRKNAGLIMIPYIAWTLFASALNFEIWRLNH